MLSIALNVRVELSSAIRSENRSTSFADCCFNYAAAIVAMFPFVCFNLTLIEFPERFVAAMLKILLKPFAYMPREISGKLSLPLQFLKGQCATKFSCSAIVRYRPFVINHVWLRFLRR